jgi:hypothetical protein
MAIMGEGCRYREEGYPQGPRLRLEPWRIRATEMLVSRRIGRRQDSRGVVASSKHDGAGSSGMGIADNGEGSVFQFDTKRTPFSTATIKVSYLSAYPAHDIVEGAYDPLFTKSADWSYEAEWRLIAEERAFAQSTWTIKTDNDFLLIPSGVLRAVIIGCLTDKSTQRRIENITETNASGVLVRKATLARDKYELVITPPCIDV